MAELLEGCAGDGGKSGAGGRADENFNRGYFRFVPQADMLGLHSQLFDHLVSAEEQRGRHIETNCFCALEIDDHIELVRGPSKCSLASATSGPKGLISSPSAASQ